MSVISADEGEVLRMFSFARKRRSNVKCQWANADDVRAAGLSADEHNRGGIILGSWRARKGRSDLLKYKGPHHVLVVGPARSGKSAGVTVPTLLNWDESVVIYDTKGENWALTSGFRAQRLGQRVLKFDPVAPDSARFNPLLEVRLDRHMLEDVQSICTLIVDPHGMGIEDHWKSTAFGLLVGVVTFLLLCDPPEVVPSFDRSLATVLAILSDGGPFRAAAVSAGAASEESRALVRDARAVFSYIREVAYSKLRSISSTDACPGDNAEYEARRVGWRIIAVSMEAWLDKPANEAGSVLSTALSFLSLYRDPIVADNTRVSDFSVESLMGGKNPDGQAVKEKTSLYLVVPPSDKDRLKPLLRIVVSQVVRRLTEGMDFDTGGGKSRFPHRLLLLIDEFPSLGKLEIFEEALAFIAGYGMKALLIVQDRVQLAKSYTKEESIFSNCHIRIAYAPNNPETADMLSKMCGQATVTHVQRQYSGNRMHIMLQNVNTNEQIVGRPLLTADECMRLPPDDEIVFVAGTAPIYCQKIKYYGDSAMAARTALGMAASTGRGPEADGDYASRPAPDGSPEEDGGADETPTGGDDTSRPDTDGEDIE